MTTWNTAFEATPADTDEIRYGAGKIRELKTAISDREELEHNFKTGTQPFHKAGLCSVTYVGTTAAIAALSTGLVAGGLAWDTTLKVMKYYSGSAWVVCDVDHGALNGLADDDHTQYLNLTKVGQNIAEDVTVTALKTIDGRDLSVDGAVLDAIVSVQNFVYEKNGEYIAITTTTPWDDTIPQITEGGEVITATITPHNAANTLVIEANVNACEYSNTANHLTVALFKGTGADALAMVHEQQAGDYSNNPQPVRLMYSMVAGSTSAATFRIRAGLDTGALDINGYRGSRRGGGVMYSWISITEYGT